MLSTKDKQTVIGILDSALGVGIQSKGNEQKYLCPFCHHHKPKLQVNLDTQKFHCWVCNSKGRTIASLLRRLNVDGNDIRVIKDIYGDEDYTYQSNEEVVINLQLPSEFRQLHLRPKSINPEYNNAISYLYNRGLTMADIVRYNIGYCEEGIYKGRVIIPSYDSDNKLNYFVARSYYENSTMKYKLAPISRDVITFESQINWNQPITLVEGTFDAFSVKRNCIPLLGKFILPKLKQTILEKGVKEITIMLDADAISESTKHTEFFIKNGIKVKNIIPTDEDAGDLGFETVTKMIKTAGETRWDDMILSKINNL